MLSQKALNSIAQNLEEYLNIMKIMIIIDASHEDAFKKSVKRVKKAIKKLRKGEWEGILDPQYVEMYRDILEGEAQ